MKRCSGMKLALVLGASLLMLLTAQAAETSLIAFELESHDGQRFTERSWAGRPLLVVVSTREAAPYNAGLVWSNPIAAAALDHVADLALLRVATLPAGIPRLFAAGIVRDAVAPAGDDRIRTVLLDWDSLFAQHYALSGEAYNVLLFDRSGSLVYSVALGAFDQLRLDEVLGELRKVASTL